jgi:hypothetical protein
MPAIPVRRSHNTVLTETVHRDFSGIRLIAVSAIVAGLLLGTAPVILAQVTSLIAGAPAAFTQQIPKREIFSVDAVDAHDIKAEIPSVDNAVEGPVR